MKILIICRSFNNMAGGIERMAAALMNEMCARGHEVSLLTWDLAGAKAFYEFDDRISWYNLDLGSHVNKAGFILRIKRMLKMRRLLKEIDPNIILAFQHGTFISSRIYSLGQGYPIISAERESPSRFEHLKAGKWQWFIYQSFRLARNITIQCESYRKEYPGYLHNKIVTISNPVFPAKCFAKPIGEENGRNKLLSVGRLSYQKNHMALIKGFSKICYDFPNWDLVIAGEGEERKILEKEIKDLGLENRISLLGAVKDTEELYCNSHLLCLASRWEGFPNVIAESLAHGLPVVGFSECGGMKDLIEDGVNGILAKGNNNPESLAQALSKLMAEDSYRGKMSKSAVKSMELYQPNKIFDRWESFLTEASN